MVTKTVVFPGKSLLVVVRECIFELTEGVRERLESATTEVTPPVAALLKLLSKEGELGNTDIRKHLQLKDRAHVRFLAEEETEINTDSFLIMSDAIENGIWLPKNLPVLRKGKAWMLMAYRVRREPYRVSRSSYLVSRSSYLVSRPLSSKSKPLSGKSEDLSGMQNPARVALLDQLPGLLAARIGALGKRHPPDMVRDLIVDLCQLRAWNVEELALLLQRNPESIRQNYLRHLLAQNRIVMTLPDTPNSPLQAYRAKEGGEQ